MWNNNVDQYSVYSSITVFIFVDKVLGTKFLELMTSGATAATLDCHVQIDARGQDSYHDTQDQKEKVKDVLLHVHQPPHQLEVEERRQDES